MERFGEQRLTPCMEPTEDRPYVFRALDTGYREVLASVHRTLNEAMSAGEEAKHRALGLQRRYVIASLYGERWVLTGRALVATWMIDCARSGGRKASRRAQTRNRPGNLEPAGLAIGATARSLAPRAGGPTAVT
jgi:hypothetical protein